MTPPSGWNVTEKDGRSKVSLTRDYKDEVLQVDFTAREYVSPIPIHAPQLSHASMYVPVPST